jgi:RNA polymerase sigma-54 factor
MSSLNLSQNQRLSQRLSPQQILYVKLLQLPSLQLEQRIKQELEENPVLEELDGESESAEQDLELPAAELPEPEINVAAPEVATPDTPPDEKPEPIATVLEKPEREKQTEEEFEKEVAEYLGDDMEGYKTTDYNKLGEDEEREYQYAYEESISEKLLKQIHLLDINEKDFAIAEEIIGNIDDDGYLRCPLESIVDGLLALGLTVTEKEIEDVLEKIWYLEPVGIGSRTLQECLLVQLAVQPPHTPRLGTAKAMIANHYEAFTMKHYEKLKDDLHLDQVGLKETIELIKKLNPKPGGGNFRQFGNYVVPDFFITKDADGNLVVTTSDRNVLQIKISSTYKRLLEDKSKPKDAREFIKQKFDSAKNFMAAIQMRRETMRKVMESIVKLQYEFFTEGKHKLRPMILKDVAEDIQMDISTISRVVNGKYVQTDDDVFELKYFFSEGIETESGEEVSNKIIKQAIKDLIDQEEATKPLADDRIAELLAEKDMKVARRTVTKYREQMQIPVARLRKRLEV